MTLYRVVFWEKVGCQNAPTVVLGGAGGAGEVGGCGARGCQKQWFCLFSWKSAVNRNNVL